MATIATSTANTSFSQAFGELQQSMMDVNVITGDMWCALRTAANTVGIYKSSNKGTSWSLSNSFSNPGGYTISDLCEIRIDAGGDHIHMVLFCNDGTNDRLVYKRIDIRTGTADVSTGVLTFGGPVGNNRSFEYSAGLLPIKNPDGSYHVLLASSRLGTSSGFVLDAVTIKNDGAFTTYLNNTLIGPTRRYLIATNDALTVSLDHEHNGDGITSAKPNAWLSWQVGTTAYAIKCTWQGYKTGWSTPTKATTVATGRTSIIGLPGRWDGSRFIIVSQNPSTTTMLDVFERNLANTGHTKRTSPAHPVGAVSAYTINYNHVTQDFRLYAVSGASTVYYVDFIRATATWGSWTSTGWTAPLSGEWGVRRGTSVTFQFDAYTETGAGSPWTCSNQIQALNFSPTAPTWITGTAGTVTLNGAAFDASQSLLLDWQFNDPNATDTQGSFALSRQIGAGTIQYWRTSDNTWQTTEQQNSSATTQLTLTTGQWLGGGGASDPAHVYKVKTWDASGLPSAYSAGLSVLPSTRIDPTLTAPTTGSTIASGELQATWTVTEQGSYRIVVINTATNETTYDSGFQVDPTPLTPSVLSFNVPYAFPDGYTGQIQLTTRNAEGLAGTTRTANFTIDFIEPPASWLIPSANPTNGGIDVLFVQPGPIGAQPTITKSALWRRKATVGFIPMNSNYDFESTVSPWTLGAGGSIARDSTHAHSGTWAMKVTPSGAAADAYGLSEACAATPGQLYTSRGWIYLSTSNKAAQVWLFFYDGAMSFLGGYAKAANAVAINWLFVQVTGSAPTGTVWAKCAAGTTGTPAVGDTSWVDEMMLIQANPDNGIKIFDNIQGNTTILDWRAVSGVDYEYRGETSADNSTTIWGPWAH